jgi:hypothetical protein
MLLGYVSMRNARDGKRQGRPVQSDAGQRLTRHVLGRAARGKRAAVAVAANPETILSVRRHERDTGPASDLRQLKDRLLVETAG